MGIPLPVPPPSDQRGSHTLTCAWSTRAASLKHIHADLITTGESTYCETYSTVVSKIRNYVIDVITSHNHHCRTNVFIEFYRGGSTSSSHSSLKDCKRK